MPPKRVLVADSSGEDDDDDPVLVPDSATPTSQPHKRTSAKRYQSRSHSAASTPRGGSQSASKYKGKGTEPGSAPGSIAPDSSYRPTPPPRSSKSTPLRQTRLRSSSMQNSVPRSRTRASTTGASVEPVLVPSRSSTPDPLAMDTDNDSSRAASPAPACLTPPDYIYLDTESRSSAGPSRGRPYVDIVFQPLEALMDDYTYGDDVFTRPTEQIRAWLLEEQENRPRSPKRRPPPRSAKRDRPARPEEDAYDDEEFEEEEGVTPSDNGESDEDEVVVVEQTRKTRQWAREHSASPDMVATRSHATRSTHPRKRHRSSSRESNASYNPNGQVSDGESEIDELGSWSDDDNGAYSPAHASTATPSILENHREFCEKCQQGPADKLLKKAQAKKKKGGRKKKRKDDDEDALISDEEEARTLEGWLECERCVVSSHWHCLADEQQKDVLTVFRKKYPDAPPRKSIEIDEEGTFTCARCVDWPVCFVCNERHIPEGCTVHVEVLDEEGAEEGADGTGGAADGNDNADDADQSKSKPNSPAKSKSPAKTPAKPNGSHDEPIDVDSDGESNDPLDLLRSDRISSPVPNKGKLIPLDGLTAPLLFRCFRCKQAAHYEHLENPFHRRGDYTLVDLAAEYQSSRDGSAWYCHCCRVWKWIISNLIAWRPYPKDAVEPERALGELPRWKDRLPREYLVKYKDRSFRHLAWIPHMWLQAVAPHRLRNFLEKGPRLDLVTDATLAARGDQMLAPTIMDVINSKEEDHGPQFGENAHSEALWQGHGPAPDENAEDSIPVDWSTVDRLLEVYLAPPPVQRKKASQSACHRIMSSPPSDEDELDPEIEDGIMPPKENMVEIGRWENMAGRSLTEDDVDEIAPRVTWFFAKWRDLQYDQSCHDTPPPVTDELRYPAFKLALERFLAARRVVVPVLNSRAVEKREDHVQFLLGQDPPAEQPDCVVGGTLMPFQLEGFQWLLYKHFSREGCILADDMGLGKTIQVCSFLGYLCSDEHKTYPHLVIVPNSTITNWVREFEKWVPHVRVVPYYGESASREIINQYELYHLGKQGKADGLKTHVVLTTYDTVTGAEFRVFNNIPRWETVVVDEGQRLKSDSSLMFNKLKKLNAVHRVLLTGTPLNNNLRELFNLLNFIDPDNFTDLASLELRFEALNEGLVLELHNMLKPYILRRIKSQVLKLPPKVEIIVPISMTPAQKRLTKIILTRSAEMIGNIRKKRRQQLAAKKRKAIEATDAADAAEVDGAVIRSAGPETAEGSKLASKRNTTSPPQMVNGEKEDGAVAEEEAEGGDAGEKEEGEKVGEEDEEADEEMGDDGEGVGGGTGEAEAAAPEEMEVDQTADAADTEDAGSNIAEQA